MITRAAMTLGVAMLCACSGRPTTRLDADAHVNIVRTDAQIDVAPLTQMIVVENPFGDIHLRRGRAEKLAYHGVAQQIHGTLAPAEVRIVHTGNVVRVLVEIAHVELADGEAWNPRRARMDLALAVPPGVEVHLRTSFGMINAMGVRNNLVATSVGGAILLNAGGGMRAQSATGSIALVQRELEFAPGMFADTSGSIDAAVPVDADVALVVSTCGAIELDALAGAIEKDAAGCQRLVMRFGAGSLPMALNSERGNISLRAHQRLP